MQSFFLLIKIWPHLDILNVLQWQCMDILLVCIFFCFFFYFHITPFKMVHITKTEQITLFCCAYHSNQEESYWMVFFKPKKNQCCTIKLYQVGCCLIGQMEKKVLHIQIRYIHNVGSNLLQSMNVFLKQKVYLLKMVGDPTRFFLSFTFNIRQRLLWLYFDLLWLKEAIALSRWVEVEMTLVSVGDFFLICFFPFVNLLAWNTWWEKQCKKTITGNCAWYFNIKSACGHTIVGQLIDKLKYLHSLVTYQYVLWATLKLKIHKN